MSDYITEELTLEILTRLPPKSLLRFRSVCKSWYSCIGNPGFIRMHTFRSPQKILIKHRQHESEGFYTLHSEHQLPLCPGRGYMGITPFEFPCHKHLYKITIGLCNGILWLTDYGREHIWLWNPSIRRKQTVPDCPRRCSEWVASGFGFDRITDDHKILIIPKTRHGIGRIVESSFVYAMKTGAWCVISSPTHPFSDVMTPNACFVNGALHWVVVNKSHLCIMTFNLSSHVFGTIALPELGPDRDTTGLTTIQGCLAMISISTQHFDNWIWVRRDASWSVVFKSETNNVLGEAILRVLKLNSHGDLLFMTCERGLRLHNPDRGKLVLQNNAASFVYDPEREAQSTRVRANWNAASWVDDILMCAETLQLLDMGTAC